MMQHFSPKDNTFVRSAKLIKLKDISPCIALFSVVFNILADFAFTVANELYTHCSPERRERELKF